VPIYYPMMPMMQPYYGGYPMPGMYPQQPGPLVQPLPKVVPLPTKPPEPGVLIGTVVDATTGQPIGSARVEISSLYYGESEGDAHRDLPADMSGGFHFIGVPITVWELTVAAPGYITVTQRATSWDSYSSDCIMVAMSPTLMPNQVRVIATWRGGAQLASCASFGKCSVGVGSASVCSTTIARSVVRARADYTASMVSRCRIGLSTETLDNVVIDNIDYKLTVPGRTAPCGGEDQGPIAADEAIRVLMASDAKVQVYVSNSAGREFVIDKNGVTDGFGWKIFQYNGTTNVFGPYTTFAPSYSGLVSGVLINAVDGKPVANAQCRLTSPSASLANGAVDLSVLSDSGGVFSFSDVPLGEWEVSVEADGFIGEAQLVRSWPLGKDGCVTIALSPSLEPQQVRIIVTYPPDAPKLGSCLKFRHCSVGEASPSCSVDLSAVADGFSVSAHQDFDERHVGRCGIGLSTVTMDDEILNNVDFKVTVPGRTAPCGGETSISHALHSGEIRSSLLRTGAQVKVYISNSEGRAFQVDAPHQLIDGEGWKVFQYNGSNAVFGPYVTPAPSFAGLISGVVIDATTGLPISGASVHLKAVSGAQHIELDAASDGQGSFHFDAVPLGDATLVVTALGYIAIEELVDAWASGRNGCVQVVLSPNLAPAQIRIVTTWQPQSPALSSCLSLENTHEECFVSADNTQCSVALPESGSSGAQVPPKLAEGKLEFEADHVGQCRIGLSTVTVLDAHIDWVDFRVFVPGMSAPCTADVPAPHEADAKDYLLKSGATVNIYLSNDAGQQFAVGPSVLVDHQGWKVFQFNGTSRFKLGPYATHAPTTLAPTTTSTPTLAPSRSFEGCDAPSPRLVPVVSACVHVCVESTQCMCRLSFGRSLPSLLCGCWRRLVHCLRHTIGCRTGSPFWETRFWLSFSQLRRHRERVGVRRGDGQASLRRQCYHIGLPHPLTPSSLRRRCCRGYRHFSCLHPHTHMQPV
jgi:hypothetical protein